ncbi:hypothetical protein D3C71_1724730 [compost metagenome]
MLSSSGLAGAADADAPDEAWGDFPAESVESPPQPASTVAVTDAADATASHFFHCVLFCCINQ